MRLIIADDSKVERDQAKRMLTEGGHEVIGQYDNGRDACAAVLRDNPDVVVLDLMMKYMTGDAAALELRRQGYKGGIVFATKNSQSAVLNTLKEVDGSLCVKMYRQDTLLAAVSEAAAKVR